MSESEAEKLIERFIEHKMMWHREDNFTNIYLVYQARNIVGEKKYQEIQQRLHNLWNKDD